MLYPERDEIRLGFHEGLGYRRPMLRPERDEIRSGFHKCFRCKRLMLYPDRDEIRLGFHEGLGSRRLMLRPERKEIRSGFHKCFRSRRLMLYPDRDEIRLGFHKGLGSRRLMLGPERDENLYGSHMCLGSLEARLCSALSQQAGRGGASPLSPRHCASTTSGGASAETGRPIEHTHQLAQNFVSEHFVSVGRGQAETKSWQRFLRSCVPTFLGPTTNARRCEIAREKERERERPPEAALQTAKGRRTGGGRGGGPGRVKGTGGFLLKIPVPNVFFGRFSVFWAGSCDNPRQGA